MRGWTVLPLMVMMLAGCSGPAPMQELPELDFDAMSVETVPLEPWEQRGILAIAWEDDNFAVSTQNEGGMPPKALYVDGTFYTTEHELGWIAWDLQHYIAGTGRGYRYLLWDVPRLIQGATEVHDADGTLDVVVPVQLGIRTDEVAVQVLHDGPRVTRIVVSTGLDPESPYTMVPIEAFPWAIGVPAPVRTAADAAAKEAEAVQGHTRLVRWVTDYQDHHAGALPETLDPESLRLEMTTRGGAWPVNPFTGAAMQDRFSSGDFTWVRCTSTNGVFEGTGWDDAILRTGFGQGCSLP